MALTSIGADVALQRNEGSLRLDLKWDTTGLNVGNPVFDDSRTHSVLSLLYSQKRGRRPGADIFEGGYYWDNTGTRGTLLWTVTHDRLSTQSQFQGYAEDGGQQLLNAKLIATFNALPQRSGPGRWQLGVAWSVPSGDYKESVKF